MSLISHCCDKDVSTVMSMISALTPIKAKQYFEIKIYTFI